MKALSLQATLIAIALLLAVGAAVSAFASERSAAPGAPAAVHQEGGGGPVATGDGGGSARDVVPMALWAGAGIAVLAVTLATLHMLKRRMGGFPANPSWVAPITVMRSAESPDEGDYGDQAPSSQAHAEH